MAKSHSRQIFLGKIPIGGGAPVMVQSMTNTDTRDPEATLAQIADLAAAGCEAVRVAVPDEKAAAELKRIVDSSPLPVIADIHFDWRLAIRSIEAGVAGLRINPGNIGLTSRVLKIVDAAKLAHTVIRIGVNSGSLQKELLTKYGRPCAEALAESALAHAYFLEKHGFHDFKLSLKSSSVTETITAYRLVRSHCDHPLHIGVTEAGTSFRGTIKSAVGLGVLLHEGIGDTLRVSLTANPVEEIRAAWEILAALDLRRRGPEIISCPTCGRTEVNLIRLAQIVEAALEGCELPIKVAVMGCVVNGPGEAREADLGVACGRDKGVIFRKGAIICSVRGEDALIRAFLAEIANLTGQPA